MKNYLCIIFSLISTIYSLFYASLGGFKGNTGALSKIGLNHPVLFFIWGILTCLALFTNISIGFQKTKYRFHYILMAIAAIGMILTLCFDFDYSKHNEYLLHCTGSMTFSIISGLTVFLLFLLSKNRIFTIITAITLIADLILLIIFKETAIIELLPIFAGYIMLNIHNFREEKMRIEVKQ